MSKTSMTAIALGAFGAALLASAASAAPLNATTIGSAEVSNVDQIGLVCNEYYRRCWRTEDGAMSCAITTTPATSPAGATTTTLAPATTIAATATADQDSPLEFGNPLRTARAWPGVSPQRCPRAALEYAPSLLPDVVIFIPS